MSAASSLMPAYALKAGIARFTAGILVVITAICGVALVAPRISTPSSSGGNCDNTPIGEFPSPDGALKAVLFERSCGATTGFSTQVSLLEAGEPLQKGKVGNLFVADSNHGRAPPASGGGPEAKIVWTGVRSMELAHHANARVFLARQNVHGVTVTYSTFE